MLPGSLHPPFSRREPEAEATVHVCFGERERKRERVCGKGNQLGYEYKSFQIGILPQSPWAYNR